MAASSFSPLSALFIQPNSSAFRLRFRRCCCRRHRLSFASLSHSVSEHFRSPLPPPHPSLPRWRRSFSTASSHLQPNDRKGLGAAPNLHSCVRMAVASSEGQLDK
ncbi:hypothetical protein ACLOJK_026744 [Asimina triloba]